MRGGLGRPGSRRHGRRGRVVGLALMQDGSLHLDCFLELGLLAHVFTGGEGRVYPAG